MFNAGYGVSKKDVKEEDEDVSKSSIEIKTTGKEVRKGKFTLSVGKNTTLQDIEKLIRG